MIVGLLLILLSVAVVVLGLVFNGTLMPEHDIMAFGHHVATVNGAELFFAGVVVTAVFFLGLWIMGVGAHRRHLDRKDLRSARRDAAEASRERDELAAQMKAPAVPAEPPVDTGRHHTAPR